MNGAGFWGQSLRPQSFLTECWWGEILALFSKTIIILHIKRKIQWLGYSLLWLWRNRSQSTYFWGCCFSDYQRWSKYRNVSFLFFQDQAKPVFALQHIWVKWKQHSSFAQVESLSGLLSNSKDQIEKTLRGQSWMSSHVGRDELPAFESESSSSVLNNRDAHRWLGATVTAVSTDRGRCFPLCCPSSWAQWLVSLRCYFQHWTGLGAINITGSKEERKKVYEWIQTNSQYKVPAKPKLELSASFSNFYSRRNIWQFVCEEELRGRMTWSCMLGN